MGVFLFNMAPKKADPKAKTSGGGGKAKKKKWSKGKVREKLNNLVLFDKAYEKLYSEVPNYKLITPSVVGDRLKLNGSLARRALRELSNKGLITLVSKHNSQLIYARATAKA